MKRILCMLAVFAFVACAADISGNWKATADFGNGPIERTFVFKVDGNKLTGETSSSMLGKSVINDGKVDGDNVSFSITAKFQDNEMKLTYKGKVNSKGDEIKLTAEGVPGGQAIEWVAKRAQ